MNIPSISFEFGVDEFVKQIDVNIRIKRVIDNTAQDVEILVYLAKNQSPGITIDALYAFTDCESSISPLGCLIIENKPHFMGVSEMLTLSTDHTVKLLKKELEVQLTELENQWHYDSLERIFIENRIYRDIEEENTWEGVLEAISKGLSSHISTLKRTLIEEDLVRLTEIRIKRISKFDIDKAQQKIEALEDDIAEVKNHLVHLVDYAINYLQKLLDSHSDK